MAAQPSSQVPIGWARWAWQLKDCSEQCLTFTEEVCRTVAKQHGFRAVNIRWEPHNWSGKDKTDHDWHITADFEDKDGFAKTAHVYTSDGKFGWSPCRLADGTIKVIFADDLNKRRNSWPSSKPPPKTFELAPPRKQPKKQILVPSPVPTTNPWRSQAPNNSGNWRRNSLPVTAKEQRDVRALASWR